MTKNQIDLQIEVKKALDEGNDTFKRRSWWLEIRSVNFM